MKLPELDSDELVQRVAKGLGACLAIGSLSRRTGALTTYIANTDRWEGVLAKATAGTGWAFPGVRLAAVAALITKISSGKAKEAQLSEMSLGAEQSRIVFQRCPWNRREVLFVVLPKDDATEEHFSVLRRVLESLRRDVAIVQAPRAEERCWN